MFAIALVEDESQKLHNESMPNVMIQDLPEHVHNGLVERARAAGTSLQLYLTTELTRLATTPTLDEITSRIEKMSGGAVGFEQAVADLREARSGH